YPIGMLSDAHKVQEITWELFELNFRMEFHSLDRLLTSTNPTDPFNPAVQACFGKMKGISNPTEIFVEYANCGPAAAEAKHRFGYFRQMCRVMKQWPGGSHADTFLVGNDKFADFSEAEVTAMERWVTKSPSASMASKEIETEPLSHADNSISQDRPAFTNTRHPPSPYRFLWEDEEPQIRIPIKEWIIGLVHVPESCTLSFMSEGFLIEINGFLMALAFTEIASATINGLDRGSPNTEVCLQIHTKPLYRNDDGWKGLGVYFTSGHSLNGIKPSRLLTFSVGERRKGRITFKSDLTNQSWNPNSWEAVEHRLADVMGGLFSISYGKGTEVALWKIARELTLATVVSGVITGDAARDNEQTTQSRSSNVRKSPPTGSSQDAARPSTKRVRHRQPGLDDTNMTETASDIILKFTSFSGGTVSIAREDLGRLQPLEYVNDTIVEFGLRLWHQDIYESNPELAKQIHVFNSFFYKKLDKKNIEEGYRAVARWTSKMDIFQAQYIIIPVHESLHWYLAVIYQPQLVLEPPFENKDGPKMNEITETESGSVQAEQTTTESREASDGTERQLPYILIMDSLGQKHNQAIDKLSLYLEFEAASRHEKDPRKLTKPVGKHAQVPTQPNFCDCGIYVLHFARTFVEKTDHLLGVIKDHSGHRIQPDRAADWNARNVGGYREQLRKRIEELSKEQTEGESN
ncbi:hypothetical protein V5O48_018212, partial [Marasmius crinis-equi]